MRHTFFGQFVATVGVIAACSLSGCGGGGGGGGSGSGHSARTGIRILHGAIDLSPVLVTAGSGSEAPAQVETARFAETTFYAPLRKGDQVVHVQALSDTSVDLATQNLKVEDNQHYSALVAGSRGSGLQLDVFLDDPPVEIPSNMSAIKVVNAVNSIGGIEVLDEQGAPLTPATRFGRAGQYVLVGAGQRRLGVARSGSSKLISSGSYDLQPKHAYTLFVCGELGYFVTTRALQD